MQQLLKKWRQISHRLPVARGQSLVETALVLPIIVFLLAGLVEISNVLVTQNRVSTAARIATSFGASNYSAADLVDTTDWATEISNVATNAVTETLDLDPNRWDIYVIRARIVASSTAALGYDYADWVSVHGLGNDLVMSESEWNSGTGDIKDEILNDMLVTLESTIDPGGLEIIATYAYHDRSSILRMPLFDLGEYTRVRGYNISRMDKDADYDGCILAPITVRFDGFSVYPSNWYNSPNPDDYVDVFPAYFPQYEGIDPLLKFPDGNGPHDFQYPNPAPVYTVPITDSLQNPSNYVQNLPGVPVKDARRGLIYLAREEDGPGGFGWLSWDGDQSGNVLDDSLGDNLLTDYLNRYPGSDSDMNTVANVIPSITTGDGDGTLEIGEWIEGSAGNTASTTDRIQSLVGIPITFIVYNETNEAGGNNIIYHVSGYMVAKIIGYSLQGSDKFLIVEFIQWNTECKQTD